MHQHTSTKGNIKDGAGGWKCQQQQARSASRALAATERPPYCGVHLLPHEKTSFDLWAERFADRWLAGGDPVPRDPVVPSTQTSPPTAAAAAAATAAAAAAERPPYCGVRLLPHEKTRLTAGWVAAAPTALCPATLRTAA
ncbi:hypothetical protein OEZ86_009667 [Tetradesmus obliquus]|uniref:Uncharacterized protein n=1 Tax=Tetradesmus obliquus TaxID=3088 RepID=A0ABY8UPV7_TETOB|nr:hypothetical protein OEZ85_001111 [Tetradesmus obliquus]WIA43154.1 hypothetical protein OEZ86_009667 [Tetradesmus obliquus]